MTTVRLWAQKHDHCFNPESDELLLDFENEKSDATQLLREYFEEWEDDECNQRIVAVLGGTYPHFDMWNDRICDIAAELDIELDEEKDPTHPLLKEMVELERRIESAIKRSGGELFMEVE